MFLKESNLLIYREMRRGEMRGSVELPRWHCRICGNMPVLRQQLRQLRRHRKANPQLVRGVQTISNESEVLAVRLSERRYETLICVSQETCEHRDPKELFAGLADQRHRALP
jgi:hypothetical protein